MLMRIIIRFKVEKDVSTAGLDVWLWQWDKCCIIGSIRCWIIHYYNSTIGAI